MDVEHAAIADYWSRHEDQCGLSVDWADAEKLCWRCAGKRKLQRSHIVSRELGGSEHASNLVLLCAQCHAEAPNVADPSFMWTWLRAHASSFYGEYWYDRGFREYEFIYGVKPFAEVQDASALLPLLHTAIRKYVRQTTIHWGQGKPNPATVAWLIRQVETDTGASGITQETAAY
jgi:hypothetical protein